MAGVSNYEITEIDHALSANTVILRVTELDENGESVGGPTYSQLGIEGIIGSPDGRALGSLGDIRIRIDVPQIWQKTSGPPRSRTGWTLVGGGGGVALCSSLPQSLAAGSAGSAGIDGEASRCDHSHPVPVATPITVQGGTNFVGASGSLARADHQHRLELNVEQDGIAIGSRPTINLIGATVADNGPNDRVDITIGADVLMRRLLPIAGINPSTIGVPFANNGAVSFIAPTGGTTLLASTPRQQWDSGAAAGSSAACRTSVQQWTRQGPSGRIDVRYIFNVGSFVSGFRAFVGLRLTAALIPAVDPSSLTDIVGMAYNLGQTQWSIMHNDAAGAAVQIPLGADFNVSTTELLSFRVQAEADGDFVVTIDNLTTGATTGPVTLAADIPAVASVLAGHAWVNTGNVAATSALMQIAAIEDRS